MAQGESNKKVANGLVALSAAAVLAVYSAGFVRTRSAADKFVLQAAERAAAPSSIAESSPATARATTEPPRAIAAAPHTASKSTIVANKAANQSEEASVVTPASQVEAFNPPSAQPSSAGSSSGAPVSAPESIPVTVTAPKADPPVSVAPPPPVAAKWKDGTYYGWGTSRHGNIQAEVVIENGRIASAAIAQCRTRYSCSVIDRLPPQVAQRQSPEVDYVSGATQSTNAFYYGVVEALAQAQTQTQAQPK